MTAVTQPDDVPSMRGDPSGARPVRGPLKITDLPVDALRESPVHAFALPAA